MTSASRLRLPRVLLATAVVLAIVVSMIGGLSSVSAAPTLTSLGASGTITGGGTITVKVTLSAATPSGGATVTLSANRPSIIPVPASLTIARGQTTASVSVVTKAARPDATVTLTATYAVVTKTKAVNVKAPALSSNSGPTGIAAGGSARFTVKLNAPAPTGGMPVTLESTEPNVLGVPASAKVPAGQTSVTFEAEASKLVEWESTLIARLNGVARSRTAWIVDPASFSLVLEDSYADGSTLRGEIRLAAPAPTGGADVRIRSSDSSVLTIPSNGEDFDVFRIESGERSRTFVFRTVTGGSAVITSELVGGGDTDSRTIRVVPLAIRRVEVSLGGQPLSVARLELPITGHSNAIVTLNGPAGPGVKNVALTSSDPLVVSVPASVSVDGGASDASVPLTLLGEGSATLTATLAGVSVRKTITVVPLRLRRIDIGAETVGVGARWSVGVILSGPAPAGGLTVALASSDRSVVRVPSSITVPADRDVAYFNLVAASLGTSTLSATAGGRTASDNVEIIPLGLAGVDVDDEEVTLGQRKGFAVTLTSVAPTGGVTVTLSSSDPSVVSIPASVVVPAGQSAGRGQVTINGGGEVTITATLGSASLSRTSEIDLPRRALSAVTAGPDATVGNPLGLRASLTLPAYTGGTRVTLTSSDPTVVDVPASVLVPAGAYGVDVSAARALADGVATVTATAGGVSRTVTIAVRTAQMVQLRIDGPLYLGGADRLGIAVFDGTPDIVGYPVELTSSDPSVVSVPTTATEDEFGTVFTTLTPVGLGSATVTASYRGRTVDVEVTVVALTVRDVEFDKPLAVGGAPV